MDAFRKAVTSATGTQPVEQPAPGEDGAPKNVFAKTLGDIRRGGGTLFLTDAEGALRNIHEARLKLSKEEPNSYDGLDRLLTDATELLHRTLSKMKTDTGTESSKLIAAMQKHRTLLTQHQKLIKEKTAMETTMQDAISKLESKLFNCKDETIRETKISVLRKLEDLADLVKVRQLRLDVGESQYSITACSSCFDKYVLPDKTGDRNVRARCDLLCEMNNLLTIQLRECREYLKAEHISTGRRDRGHYDGKTPNLKSHPHATGRSAGAQKSSIGVQEALRLRRNTEIMKKQLGALRKNVRALCAEMCTGFVKFPYVLQEFIEGTLGGISVGKHYSVGIGVEEFLHGVNRVTKSSLHGAKVLPRSQIIGQNDVLLANLKIVGKQFAFLLSKLDESASYCLDTGSISESHFKETFLNFVGHEEVSVDVPFSFTNAGSLTNERNSVPAPLLYMSSDEDKTTYSMTITFTYNKTKRDRLERELLEGVKQELIEGDAERCTITSLEREGVDGDHYRIVARVAGGGYDLCNAAALILHSSGPADLSLLQTEPQASPRARRPNPPAFPVNATAAPEARGGFVCSAAGFDCITTPIQLIQNVQKVEPRKRNVEESKMDTEKLKILREGVAEQMQFPIAVVEAASLAGSQLHQQPPGSDKRPAKPAPKKAKGVQERGGTKPLPQVNSAAPNTTTKTPRTKVAPGITTPRQATHPNPYQAMHSDSVHHNQAPSSPTSPTLPSFEWQEPLDSVESIADSQHEANSEQKQYIMRQGSSPVIPQAGERMARPTATSPPSSSSPLPTAGSAVSAASASTPRERIPSPTPNSPLPPKVTPLATRGTSTTTALRAAKSTQTTDQETPCEHLLSPYMEQEGEQKSYWEVRDASHDYNMFLEMQCAVRFTAENEPLATVESNQDNDATNETEKEDHDEGTTANLSSVSESSASESERVRGKRRRRGESSSHRNKVHRRTSHHKKKQTNNGDGRDGGADTTSPSPPQRAPRPPPRTQSLIFSKSAPGSQPEAIPTTSPRQMVAASTPSATPFKGQSESPIVLPSKSSSKQSEKVAEKKAQILHKEELWDWRETWRHQVGPERERAAKYFIENSIPLIGSDDAQHAPALLFPAQKVRVLEQDVVEPLIHSCRSLQWDGFYQKVCGLVGTVQTTYSYLGLVKVLTARGSATLPDSAVVPLSEESFQSDPVGALTVQIQRLKHQLELKDVALSAVVSRDYLDKSSGERFPIAIDSLPLFAFGEAAPLLQKPPPLHSVQCQTESDNCIGGENEWSLAEPMMGGGTVLHAKRQADDMALSDRQKILLLGLRREAYNQHLVSVAASRISEPPVVPPQGQKHVAKVRPVESSFATTLGVVPSVSSFTVSSTFLPPCAPPKTVVARMRKRAVQDTQPADPEDPRFPPLAGFLASNGPRAVTPEEW